MAVIAVTPLYLSNSTLKIGADNYEAAVSSVKVTPNVTTAQFRGLTPSAVYKKAVTDWTCEVEFVQDWKTAGSLSNYLLANANNTVTAVFVPDVGGPSVTVSIVLTPPEIGGAVGEFATTSVQMGVNGVPTVA